MDNKRYYIELEVLTPLAVGAGNDNDWICGADYVMKDRKVYILDMERAVQLGVDLGRLATAFANSDQRAIINLMGNRLEQASIRIFDAPASTTNAIKAFMRTKLIDRPVVPGSSLKGAIRSCLFNEFHGPKRQGEQRLSSNVINEGVFGTMTAGDVFTRFIHVGDIIMPQTRLVNTKLFNLRGQGNNWYGGWKHGGNNTTARYESTGFNTLYECVAPGQKGIGVIDMAGGAYELLCAKVPSQAYLDKKRELMQGGLGALFHIINNTTRQYLEKERVFFETFRTDRVDEIVEKIDELLQLIPADDSYCVMKMSAGAGFHSITGDWQYHDYCNEPGIRPDSGKKRFKSRKIAEYDHSLQQMGFVLLREIATDGETAYHKHLERMQVSDAQLRAEAEAAARKAADEEARRKQAEEAKRKALESKYDALMAEAKALAEAKKWDEAIAKAQEAGQLMPEGDGHATWLKNWTEQKAIDVAKRQEQETAEGKFKAPLAEVLKPSSLGNVIGTTKKWVERNGGIDAFGEPELQALSDAVSSLPNKERKKIGGKRSDLIKAIGEHWTERLLSKFA